MRPTKFDDLISNNLRVFVPIVIGFFLLVGVAAVSVFFYVLRGDEQVMVPNVQGMEITDALLELQTRELNARVQLRYSQSPQDRGLILEQDPPPGMIVRVGRRVRLVISHGVVIDRMDNFVGRQLDSVRLDLQRFPRDPAARCSRCASLS
jgi:beta-lactam-binding protein with PASTA domain